MTNQQDNRHMPIIQNSKRLVSSLESLFYADSNEKAILRDKLKSILGDNRYQHALDLGAGPGHVATVLDEHASELTLVEVTEDYYTVLKEKFPKANVEINSFLDFNYPAKYDLILLSHVLYYVSVNEWEPSLQNIYRHLSSRGKLIMVHAPCHQIHKIFADTLSRYNQIAYLSETEMEKMLKRIGGFTRETCISLSYFNGKLSYDFARQYLSLFFGLDSKFIAEQCTREQLDELLLLFTCQDERIALEYHSDIYIFDK